MDSKTIAYLEGKSKQLSECFEQKEKDKIRNDMFIKMEPFIDIWLKGNLNYRQMFMENDERLSLCWDCFEFCLKYYHPERNISLVNHFYRYTKFFLLSWFAEKKKREDINDPGATTNDGKLNNCTVFYEQIDDLKQFRKMIPEDYKTIFDDAILSMAGRPVDKIPYRKSNAYSYYKYCESKKVFKIVIDFLLHR